MNVGTPETLSRRERRRRQAVRTFLLDSLRELDGVEYVREDAQEGPQDAPGTHGATEWDNSAMRGECAVCGRVDALWYDPRVGVLGGLVCRVCWKGGGDA